MWWRRLLYKEYWVTLKISIRQLVFRKRVYRDVSKVKHDYGLVWSKGSERWVKGEGVRLQFLYGQPILCQGIENRRFALAQLQERISSIKPRNIIELGSGNGINLLVLAILNPEVELCGLELTPEGVMASRAMLANPPVAELAYLTGVPRELVSKRLQNRKVVFVEGDMRSLPFEDKSFDFVFSWVSFEQIPRDYIQAFREAKRVCSGYAVFLEAFREAQKNIFQRLSLYNLDYFRASFYSVEKVGFTLLGFTPLPLIKVKYSIGEVFVRAF